VPVRFLPPISRQNAQPVARIKRSIMLPYRSFLKRPWNPARRGVFGTDFLRLPSRRRWSGSSPALRSPAALRPRMGHLSAATGPWIAQSRALLKNWARCVQPADRSVPRNRRFRPYNAIRRIFSSTMPRPHRKPRNALHGLLVARKICPAALQRDDSRSKMASSPQVSRECRQMNDQP